MDTNSPPGGATPLDLPGHPVATADGSYTLRHAEWDEEFHSHLGARTEAEALYIEASGFCDALSNEKTTLAVLDVGLGLAYNALATIAAWESAEHPPDLEITSLEIDRRLVVALQTGDAAWMVNWSQEWRQWSRSLRQTLPDFWEANIIRPDGRTCRWRVVVGDGMQGALNGVFDFIWQDPFSPKKNPTMWSAAWFAKIQPHAHAHTVLVTYSVAGAVREALQQSGWRWEKMPAQGAKKHWLKAHVSRSAQGLRVGTRSEARGVDVLVNEHVERRSDTPSSLVRSD